jgi:hypothetical protein
VRIVSPDASWEAFQEICDMLTMDKKVREERFAPKMGSASPESPWDNARRVADNRLRAMLHWSNHSSTADVAKFIDICRKDFIQAIQSEKARRMSSPSYVRGGPELLADIQRFDRLDDVARKIDPYDRMQIEKAYELIGMQAPR